MGMDKLFHPILYWSSDYLPMLESMFTRVCWRNSHTHWYHALSKSCPMWDYKLRLIEMCHATLMLTSLIKSKRYCSWQGDMKVELPVWKSVVWSTPGKMLYLRQYEFTVLPCKEVIHKLKCFSIFFVHIILVILLVIGHTKWLTCFVDVPW